MCSGIFLFIWFSFTTNCTFCTSIFNFLRVPLKPLFFLVVSFGLPLGGVLSINSFDPGFKVIFWLELCVTLLLQKSDQLIRIATDW